jgi:hypothetical protein
MPCCQYAQALGQTLAGGVQNTWTRRPPGQIQHRTCRLGSGQQSRHHLPSLGPVRGSVQLRVSAVANHSAAQQYIQHPATPSYGPPPASVTVTWTGLLAALGLAATALLAAATTCFFLYIKPVMQVSYVSATTATPCSVERLDSFNQLEHLSCKLHSAVSRSCRLP